MSGPAGDAERPPATLPLPNALGYVVAGLCVLAAVAQAVAVFASGATPAGALASFDLFTMAPAAVLGVLILRRRPGHVIGWVLVGIGVADAVFGLGRLYRLATGLGEDDDPLHFTWVFVAAGLLIALPQLFPDGRLPSRLWCPLAVYAAAITVVTAVGVALDPNENDDTALLAVAKPLFACAILASLAPLVVRFRRSAGVQRQQFKWVFYGFVLGCSPFAVATALDYSVTIPEAVFALTVTLASLVVPGAITGAVLRYRLYDIDVVISKTLLVAGLAGFITTAYVAIVIGIGSLIHQGYRPDPVLSVAATALVAVAFQPARRTLQRVANRLVYGHRATPYDVLSGFATRIGAAEPSPDTLDRLASLMAGGTGADPARVWLRVGSELRPAATWPPRDGLPDAVDTAATTPLPDADLALPVRDRGELLGVLTIAKPRGERVTDADSDLLGRLAAAAGVVLRNLRLDAELAERLRELEASRRRLVTAQDEARRRIEADLAGGSRAHLTGLREQLSVLAGEVDPAAAPRTATLLDQLVAQAGVALDTLDGLAAGIYPPRLAADGLAAALTEQAGRAGLAVTVDADGVGRYPRDVEAATYFCVLEALQNVAKYARAGSAGVRLVHDGGLLRFEVRDDGAGFDSATTPRGTGLQGMADRLDTVGGTLTVRSSPGAGTTVGGEVPAVGVETAGALR